MADDDERALVGFERAFELFDRLEVEVVGRLVEEQAVDAAGGEEGERGAGALARGEGGGGARDVVGSECELGEELPCRSWRER